MSRTLVTHTIQLPNQPPIIIETGKLAQQADGSVLLKAGDTMLLATAVFNEEVDPTVGFLPLYVDYQEKFASAGRIPGGFLRREGRLGDHEVLISRLVDRAVRPLFPSHYRHETQINIFLISADAEIAPETLAGLAASAALMISPIPFAGPIAEVRVARIDGQFVINPLQSALLQADMDLIVAGSEKNIIMVEGEMSEVQESDVIDAIHLAHETIKLQCQGQREFASLIAPIKFEAAAGNTLVEQPSQSLQEAFYQEAYAIAKKGLPVKHARQIAFKNLRKAHYDRGVQEQGLAMNVARFHEWCYEIERQVIRDLAFKEGLRLDGRKLDQVRSIDIEIDYLPGAHGSALFTRGETQSLSTITLGTKLDEQIIDRALFNGYNRFMLHYNFPGFSTGEVKPNRAPGRREIGHGNLAMRALKKVLPPDKDNPYTIRAVSDILSSNGSSSMATVCGVSLSLMDAGVPISSGVAGIAMGLLIDEETDKYVILSDILGDEDALGDMDFKVAGTAKGITACQMDIKIAGLTEQVISIALEQAKAGRLHILAEMNKAIASPNATYKKHAPRFSIIEIPRSTIGAVIGPGGKVVQEIQRESGATIVIEEVEGKGIVRFYAPNQTSIQMAEKRVRGLTAEPIVGEVYQGKVKSILPFGAFVEFLPGKEGLVHISEVKWERIENLEKVLTEGEVIAVKLLEVDARTGKYKLSRKALLPNPEAPSAA